ncbi:hypothetical protein TNCV_4429391 [Trichonephila clavipes]|nr:hypothetical protein TNCV_4429391 [Trichonephila clavipes]
MYPLVSRDLLRTRVVRKSIPEGYSVLSQAHLRNLELFRMIGSANQKRSFPSMRTFTIVPHLYVRFGMEGRYAHAFRRESSKPETDESPLVRDQDCMAGGVGTPNQEF